MMLQGLPKYIKMTAVSLERWLTTTAPATPRDRTYVPRTGPIEVAPRESPTIIELDRALGGRRMVPIVGFGLVFP